MRIADVVTYAVQPGRHAADRRQGRHRPARPPWLGLRHLHAAVPGGRGPGIERHLKPFAIGPRRGGHRRLLAQRHARQLLAQRPGAEQRRERRRDGALGHQGQGRGPAPCYQLWGGRSRGTGGRVRARQRARAAGGSWTGRWNSGRRASATSAARSAATRVSRPDGSGSAAGSLADAGRQRLGLLRSRREAAPGAGHVRARPCGAAAGGPSCCTTSTSGWRRSTRCAWPRRWSRTGCSSWRTRLRRRTSATFRMLRTQCAVAAGDGGELFVHPLEVEPLVSERA